MAWMWGEGTAHLGRREHQAHDEVGEPVHSPVHRERSGPGGLQEDLHPHHRGDRAWRHGRAQGRSAQRAPRVCRTQPALAWTSGPCVGSLAGIGEQKGPHLGPKTGAQKPTAPSQGWQQRRGQTASWEQRLVSPRLPLPGPYCLKALAPHEQVRSLSAWAPQCCPPVALVGVAAPGATLFLESKSLSLSQSCSLSPP